MKRVLFALVLAGCGPDGYDNGHAVAVTVNADSTVAVDSARTLHLVVSGAESFEGDLALTAQLSTGAAKFLYRPLVRAGVITLAIAALDDGGVELGYGESGGVTLRSGQTVTARVTLSRRAPMADMAIAPDDLLPPPDLMCAHECATVDETRCNGTMVETCALVNGCRKWSAPGPCGADSLCCGSACVPANASNCYACGTTCSGMTPVCSPSLQRCACSVGICAAMSLGCSPTTGGCVTCTPLAANASDIYVDATSFAGGTGTQACPLTTITNGIATANNSGALVKTVHVAAGTYEAPAETFPLIVRNGISLDGAGAAQTIIKGTGSYDHSGEGGQFAGTYPTTLLVGNETGLDQTISNLTLRIDDAALLVNSIGLFCDRGNAPAIANPPPSPFPTPLQARNLTISGKYHYGVIVTNSTTPSSGCNFKLTGSTVDGPTLGLWALGAGLAGGTATVAVEVGDDSEMGRNTFKNLIFGTLGGGGISAWDNTSPVRINRNTFEMSETGVTLANHSGPGHVVPSVRNFIEVKNNSFRNLSNYGVFVDRTATIDLLSGNLFTNISTPANNAFRGIALVIASHVAAGPRARVKTARSNQFIGNDVAVEFRGNAFAAETGVIVDDFGTASDPGMNVFRCNSRLTTPSPAPSLYGNDIAVLPQMTGGPAMTFAGNFWDRATPTELTAPIANENGADIYRAQQTNPPTMVTTGGQASTVMCPADRAAGP